MDWLPNIVLSPLSSPVLLVLTVVYLIARSIETYDIRLNQAKMGRMMSGVAVEAGGRVLPTWVGIIIPGSWVLFVVLLALNWKFAGVLYVIVFILKVIPVMERIGWFLMRPLLIEGEQDSLSQPIIEQDSSSTEDDDDEEYDFAKEMLAAYLKVSREYLMYRVVDESRLPFKKEDLKTAIKLRMYYHDSDSLKEAFRESYYQLSKYQPDSETLENLQRISMDVYEEVVEHEGTDIDEDERLLGLIDAVENVLNLEDTEAVDHEKELLVAELKLWEVKLELEEAKQDVRDYISSLDDDSEQGTKGDADKL